MPRMPQYVSVIPRSPWGIGDAAAPVSPPEPSFMEQAIAGLKVWQSPTQAFNELKGAFSGTAPAPARLAGLAIVPVAALALFWKGKR